MTTRVHDERLRREERLHLVEPEESLLALRDETRGGRLENREGVLDLRRQRGDRGVTDGTPSSRERGTCLLRPDAPHGDPRYCQLVNGARRRREGRGIDLPERSLRLVDAPDQEEPAHREIARMRRVDPVAVLLERRPGGVERTLRPAEIA